jgi:hypothetical protein
MSLKISIVCRKCDTPCEAYVSDGRPAPTLCRTCTEEEEAEKRKEFIAQFTDTPSTGTIESLAGTLYDLEKRVAKLELLTSMLRRTD